MFVLYYLIIEDCPLSVLNVIQSPSSLLEKTDSVLYKHPAFIYRKIGRYCKEYMYTPQHHVGSVDDELTF